MIEKEKEHERDISLAMKLFIFLQRQDAGKIHIMCTNVLFEEKSRYYDFIVGTLAMFYMIVLKYLKMKIHSNTFIIENKTIRKKSKINISRKEELHM